MGQHRKTYDDDYNFFYICLALVVVGLDWLFITPVKYIYNRFGGATVALGLSVLALCLWCIPWHSLAPFIYAYLVAIPLARFRLGIPCLFLLVWYIMHYYKIILAPEPMVVSIIGIILLWILLYRILSVVTDRILGTVIGTGLLLHWIGYPVFLIFIIELIIIFCCSNFFQHEPISGPIKHSPQANKNTSVYRPNPPHPREYDGPDYDVDCCDKLGRTPLHRVNNAPLAEKLIKMGADVNARDNYGKTPLHYARSSDIARVLLAHDADINIIDNYGKTPMENGNVSDALCMQKGTNLNVD